MAGADPLSRKAVEAFDAEGRLGEILDLGEHLRDALWRVESANIAAHPTPDGLLVVGVDGLQRGAELLSRARPPELITALSVRSAALAEAAAPAGAQPSQTALLMSYSGEDAPVLEAFERTAPARRVVLTTGGALATAARAQGVPVVPLPGGFPAPKLALGYSIVVTLELARLAGLGGSTRAMIDAAAAHVTELARDWGPDSAPDSPVKQIASASVLDPRSASASVLDPPSASASDPSVTGLQMGETPLERVLAQVLFEHLLELYVDVLGAAS
jgi:glucose/mannose-6-phosphate isomerase